MIQFAHSSRRVVRHLLLLGALLLASSYALRAGDVIGSGNGDGARATTLPARVFLDQNYPNPFNPSTMIRYGLPEGSNVRITIHSLLGNQMKTIVDTYQDAGIYTLNLSAQDLPSGVYFYRLETDYGTLTRRMTIQK